MKTEIKLFNTVFNENFFLECNSKVKNDNWEKVFEKLFFENINYYKCSFDKIQFNKILKTIEIYYQNMNQIRTENQLLYDFLKDISNIKFILKTRIKSINSIFEKIIRKNESIDINDIDASTIILIEYNGEDILKLDDKRQLRIYNEVMDKIQCLYANLEFYPIIDGNNYTKNPKIGKIIDIEAKPQYRYRLNSNEIPRYFSLHKTFKNIENNRKKEVHINSWEAEKSIRGNTTLNHYIYKPFKIDKFLIFYIPNHWDIWDDCILDYNLVESFDYNFGNKIYFENYLFGLKKYEKKLICN